MEALRRILWWFKAKMRKLQAPSSKEEMGRSSPPTSRILKLPIKKSKRRKSNRNSDNNKKHQQKNKETSSRPNKWCLETTKNSLQAQFLKIDYHILLKKTFIKNVFNMHNKLTVKIWTTSIRWIVSKHSKTRSCSNIIKEATVAVVVIQISMSLQR